MSGLWLGAAGALYGITFLGLGGGPARSRPFCAVVSLLVGTLCYFAVEVNGSSSPKSMFNNWSLSSVSYKPSSRLFEVGTLNN